MQILKKNIAIARMDDRDGRLDVVMEDPERNRYPIRLWRGEGVKQLPDPEWVVKNFVTKGGLTIVYGPPASGKSLLMLDLAQRVQMGEAFLDNGVVQGNVLYIMAEGQFGLKGRLEAWQLQNLSPELPPVAYHIEGVSFWSPPGSSINDAAESIVMAAEALEIDVVFVDTMAATFGGGNENQAQDMNMYLRPLRELRQMGVSVVVSHHVNRSEGRIRGSTVLAGEADTLVEMVPTMDAENPGVMKYCTVVCQKQKDYVPFIPFRMRLKSIELETYGDRERTGPVLIEYNEVVLPHTAQVDVFGPKAHAIVRAVYAEPGIAWRKVRRLVSGKTTDLAEIRNRLEAMGVIEHDGTGYIPGPVPYEFSEGAEIPPLLGHREEEE